MLSTNVAPLWGKLFTYHAGKTPRKNLLYGPFDKARKRKLTSNIAVGVAASLTDNRVLILSS